LTSDVFHEAGGLIVRADRRIPGLPLTTPGSFADVHLYPERTPSWAGEPCALFYTSPRADGCGAPSVTVLTGPDGFRFRYADGTDVWIAASAREIWCTWSAGATLEDTATYLTGPVLGFVFRLRGGLALHASAVRANSGVVALVGPHGAGKSTTAAALGRRGYRVVTDDVLHLSREGARWVAHPFAEHLRLWPEGAALALGEDVDLPRLTPTWNKRALAVGAPGTGDAGAAAPLAAAVILGGVDDAADLPQLHAISPAEALVALAANSSCAHLLTPEMRAHEFDMLSGLVRGVPCARATASARPKAFGPFVELLEQWMLEQATSHVA
jgi:hypothetical protein